MYIYTNIKILTFKHKKHAKNHPYIYTHINRGIHAFNNRNKQTKKNTFSLNTYIHASVYENKHEDIS